ncbi:PLP-dependent aminotransferase family protein [Halomonas urumqiensis]|uniref:GntR family transcriptional regulator n=1 Tax=Halomonas urumqiensis TaxID=1684789 RepID=A0A2N7UDC7_9GAMM|nr:PLP-dependent aminotransferase family protein [Halomonas urumqiensis]PMR78454.1 GntR family transcriptional regulator [Halomonas urumqiensis]PTB03599.1 PLP-dependent aminotransferase family protein [Halomonas urumqiensis]GHE20195.1 GntR family transcriptional regulator [Halomonas urumqiensis]
MTRYEEVAAALRQRIEHDLYRVGDRLPSLRRVCEEFQVSVSTAQEAFRRLEDAALIEARPRSGFFVLPRHVPDQLPAMSRPAQCPLDVSQWDDVLDLVGMPGSHPLLMLGTGIPDLKAPTLRPLTRQLATLHRRHDPADLNYDSLIGSLALRQQVVRLAAASGCLLHPDDVLITTGCQEALSIAIRATTSPGDVVVVDSPSFYGTLQILKANGLKALEIPTDPRTGISLEALELALEQWPVKAIQVTPTCNNPLGYTMPEARKAALVALAKRFDVAIIEDDIYGDLAYGHPRPRTLKSFDTDGRVLLCSGFSKTLSPGLRVGWLAPGCYRDRAMHMKYVSTGASAKVPQLAVAEFIAHGHYERHLREVSRQYQRHRDSMIGWINACFPAGTGVSYPQGGFMLWLELPGGVDCHALNQRLAEQHIRIAPGTLFSASGKYRHCLRINHAAPLTDAVSQAIRCVGATVATMVDEQAATPVDAEAW